MFVCACVHVSMYLRVHNNVCVYMGHVCVSVSACVCARVCLCVHVSVCMCVYVSVGACICVCMLVRGYCFTWDPSVCVYHVRGQLPA